MSGLEVESAVPMKSRIAHWIPGGYWILNPDPLAEHEVLLTTEQSLKTNFYILNLFVFMCVCMHCHA